MIVIDKRFEGLVRGCVENLARLRKTVAIAESCTGGLVTFSFATIPGASEVLRGGIVAYSNIWKQMFLDVRTETLQTRGAVSQETVIAMVDGLEKTTDAWCFLSVSGIAGPTGGGPSKPVGTVWFGLKKRGEAAEARAFVFKGGRFQVQIKAAQQAVWLLDEFIRRSSSN